MRAASLALLLPMAACSTTPPVTVPRQALPAAYWAPKVEGLPPADWWRRRMDDPALAELVAAALASSPDLAAASARIEQARAGLRAREAERMPSVDANASITSSRSSPNEGGLSGFEIPGGPEIDREQLFTRAGVEASWDADLFGRLRADARAAGARLEAAGFDAAAVRLTLVTDVARNLVAARGAVAREAAARESAGRARDSLELAAVRVRAGLVPGIDRSRAETSLAESAATVPPLEAERAARIAALAALTGLAPARIDTLVRLSAAVPQFGSPVAGVPSDLLLRRPDVQAALARIAAADAETASATAARFPRLSITGTVGLVATALGDLFSADALTSSLGPTLAGPLLDFGRNRARVEEARGRTKEAVANYRSKVLEAFSEVETTLAAVDAGRRRVLALQRQLASSRETSGVARIQYRSGLSDYLGVLDAERSESRAREQLAAAEVELAAAQLALFQSIGGDYSRDH